MKNHKVYLVMEVYNAGCRYTSASTLIGVASSVNDTKAIILNHSDFPGKRMGDECVLAAYDETYEGKQLCVFAPDDALDSTLDEVKDISYVFESVLLNEPINTSA